VLHLARRCYTSLVPTKRQRFTVTATDELTRALDEAGRRWPEERDAPSHLLLHLVEAGYLAIRREREALVAADVAAIEQAAGALTGSYPNAYLHDLRTDWPE
jgi:hypothetical protein